MYCIVLYCIVLYCIVLYCIVDEPTDCCAPMVVVQKPSGEIRICVDLIKLKANIKREVHPLPSVDYTMGKIGNSEIFSKIDANSAFWKENYQKNQNCLPHSSHHGVDIALRHCLMASPLAQSNFKSHGRKVGRLRRR